MDNSVLISPGDDVACPRCIHSAANCCKHCKFVKCRQAKFFGSSTPIAATAYGYSPLSGGVGGSQRFKNSGDDRIYAYENFDCINECMEETSEQINQMIDIRLNCEEQQEEEDDDEEDDEHEKCFTCNLVEDGFIRMSSPIEEDLIDLDAEEVAEERKKTATTSAAAVSNQFKPLEKINYSSKHEANNETEIVEAFEKKLNYQATTNFPNVGSSPVSEEFNNSDVSSSENDETDLLPAKYDRLDDEPRPDFDGIILLGNLESSGTSQHKEVASLSDDEEIVVEEDIDDQKHIEDLTEDSSMERLVCCKSLQQEFYNHSRSSVPQSIMKSSSKYIGPTHNNNSCHTQEFKEASTDLFSIATSSITSLSNSNAAASCLSTNYVNELNSAQTQATSKQVHASQKPKVRFNLDINYEKEREWNRVNRIIGDASKSQIEWTQEVEV